MINSKSLCFLSPPTTVSRTSSFYFAPLSLIRMLNNRSAVDNMSSSLFFRLERGNEGEGMEELELTSTLSSSVSSSYHTHLSRTPSSKKYQSRF